jgi:hypothetical protein
MVVIAGDGRKLWFTAAEVQAASTQLDMQARKGMQTPSSKTPVKLTTAAPSSQPHGGALLRAAISSDLKVKHDHPDQP